MVAHGNNFLRIIRDLSQGLNLTLDGEATIETAITRKVYPVPNQPKKLTPAKFEAWKMWHLEGLSIWKIAVCYSIFSIYYGVLPFMLRLYLTFNFFNHRTSLVDLLLLKSRLFMNI